MKKKESRSKLIRFSDGRIESFYGSGKEAEAYAKKKAGRAGKYIIL